MGTHKETDFYDDAFNTVPEYQVHYTESERFQQWKQILSIIKGICVKGKLQPSILEIGCGVGQFAQMLHDKYDEIIEGYLGIDFSGVACDRARAVLPGEKYQIAKMDLEGDLIIKGCIKSFPALYKSFDIVIALEVLEHFEDDIEVLKNIKHSFMKEQSHIVFTVPDFDSEAHVRVFPNEECTRERYKDLLDFVFIDKYSVGLSAGSEFICVGRFK